MSKLAHSNEETMLEIEIAQRISDGELDMSKCFDCGAWMPPPDPIDAASIPYCSGCLNKRFPPMSDPTTAETPTMRADQAESIRRLCSRLRDEARVLEVEIACKSRTLEETRAQYDALQQLYNDFLNETQD